jgi:hypothetical protein
LVDDVALPAALSDERILSALDAVADAVVAPSTHALYESIRRTLRAHHGMLPPYTRADALVVIGTAAAGTTSLHPSTLRGRLAAMSHANASLGQPSIFSDPVVLDFYAGYARQYSSAVRDGSVAPSAAVPPLPPDVVDALLAMPVDAHTEATVVTLLGFFCMFRPKSIVAMHTDDVLEQDNGLVRVAVRDEKTTQFATRPRILLLPPRTDSRLSDVLCSWSHRRQLAGALFMFGDGDTPLRTQHITDCVRDAVRVTDTRTTDTPASTDQPRLSGKSLRAGGATAARLSGVNTEDTLVIGNWRSRDMLEHYVRLRAAPPSEAVARELHGIARLNK